MAETLEAKEQSPSMWLLPSLCPVQARKHVCKFSHVGVATTAEGRKCLRFAAIGQVKDLSIGGKGGCMWGLEWLTSAITGCMFFLDLNLESYLKFFFFFQMVHTATQDDRIYVCVFPNSSQNVDCCWLRDVDCVRIAAKPEAGKFIFYFFASERAAVMHVNRDEFGA